MVHDFSNRPVVIVLHGSSVKTLEDNIKKYEDLNITYCSLNHFSLLEKNILSKINKQLQLVYISACDEFLLRKKEIEEFIARENSIFLTTPQTIWESESEEFFNKNNSKISFAKLHMFRPEIYPNSLTILLMYLIRHKARKIGIFGFDGISEVEPEQIKETYYHKEDFKPDRNWNLIEDTKNFNKYFLDLLYKVEDESTIKRTVNITNFNPKSNITAFRKLPMSGFREWYSTIGL